ncbi:MAG: tRNA pseudouridine(55) synthase TruB [Burkholderiales bacterium]|nr:tRNA pseudouridine(55) synthase TruB [Burkholderiales bacterium]
MRARNGGPDGVLLLDKPAGLTSTRALARAKRALGSLKGGHTGTLDPFATGLLPLVFGEATKFSRFLIDARKAYEATLRLGEETATGDTEADVSKRSPVDVQVAGIDAALVAFLGHQDQVPPMHSAVRIDGKRLYEHARAGVEIERPARPIEIGALERIAFDGRDLAVRVECSKGTYIRTLAQDVGAALGCGAHLVQLRRTAVGGFHVADAVTFEMLEADGIPGAMLRLMPTDALVEALPRLDASPDEATRFMHGRLLARTAAAPGADVAVYSPEGRFLGVGREEAGGIAPLRLMASAAPGVP